MTIAEQQLETRSVDAKAMRWMASPLKFADVAVDAVDGVKPTPRVSLLARTADAIEHWYWGAIVHDMAGFVAPESGKVIIDWCHSCDDQLGFADAFTANAETGLTIGGMLLPMRDDDRASEILYKASKGVPYQASMDWSPPAEIEWVPTGAEVEVNGRTFVGPIAVVRKWTVAAVAICPHGADSDTSIDVEEFAATNQQPTQVTIFTASENRTMSAQQKFSPPANHQEAATDPRAELSRFVAAFGAEKGAAHFTAGTDFAKALETEFAAQKEVHAKFVAELQAKHADDVKKLTETNAALQQQIDAAKKLTAGDDKGVKFGEPAEKQGQPATPTKFMPAFTNSIEQQLAKLKSA